MWNALPTLPQCWFQHTSFSGHHVVRHLKHKPLIGYTIEQNKFMLDPKRKVNMYAYLCIHHLSYLLRDHKWKIRWLNLLYHFEKKVKDVTITTTRRLDSCAISFNKNPAVAIKACPVHGHEAKTLGTCKIQLCVIAVETNNQAVHHL